MSFKHVVLLKSNVGQCGGLEKYALRIACAFANNHAKVSILSSEFNLPTSLPKITFHSFKTNSWPPFLRMEQFDRAVRSWLKENKADLIFGMDRNRFQTHIRAGNGVHISYLKSRILTEGRLKYWACLCNPKHRKILELEKAAFENPELKKLFANSHMVRNQLLEHYSIDPKKIEVIHNGVEWNEMELAFSQREESRLAYQFLFIGNGYLRKGLDPLLKAFSRLKNKDFHLSVVGKDKYIDQYKAKAESLGLSKKVSFFGKREDILTFYQKADALVIPSFYDPFANVTVEALAMGLFVISSKYNGGHEILNAQNGCIIEDLLSTDSLVASLEEAMSHPKTKSNAESARRSVAHLDFSTQLSTLINACG